MTPIIWLSAGVLMLMSLDIAFADIPTSLINERLLTLEKQGQEQQTELGELRTVVETQNQKLAEQKLVIQELLEWKRDNEAGNPVRQADTANRLSCTGSNRVGRLVFDDLSQVAFHAVLVSNGNEVPVAVNQAIIFDTVKLNIGGGFHSQHGLFIAPIPGVYLFSLSILTSAKDANTNDDWTDAALLKNGERLAGVFGHGAPHDQGSVTVIVQLKTADEVWAGHLDLKPVFGNYYTSFTGCLLYPTEA